MSTLIVQSGSIAQNLSVGVANATPWTSPQNGLVSDGQYAINNFAGSATPGITAFLYLSGFNLNLPNTAVIEGIEAQVNRSGAGNTSDYYVGLAYEASTIEITAPNKALAGSWGFPGAVIAYGGPTDLWNNAWSYSTLNNAAFGFAIAAQGDGATGAFAYVDGVTITVYYHQNILFTGTGGGKGGGTAEVSCLYNSGSPTSEPETNGQTSWQVVQHTAELGSQVNPVTISLNNVTGGNYLVLCLADYNGNWRVTDNQGNTWYGAENDSWQLPAGQTASIFTAQARYSGDITVTLTDLSQYTDFAIVLFEMQPPVGSRPGNYPTSSNVGITLVSEGDAGSLTPHSGRAFVAAFLYVPPENLGSQTYSIGTRTPGTGFTNLFGQELTHPGFLYGSFFYVDFMAEGAHTPIADSSSWTGQAIYTAQMIELPVLNSASVLGGGSALPGYGMVGSGGALGGGAALVDNFVVVMTGGAVGENTATVAATYDVTATGGSIANGAATPDGKVYSQTTTGVGGVGGGKAVVWADYNVVASSGAQVFLEVDPWYNYAPSGGVRGSSSAIITETDNVTGSGGALGKGSAIQTENWNETLVSAGVLGGGHVPQGITGYTTGRGSIGGGSGEIGITIQIASAGAVCNGTAIVHVTFMPAIRDAGVVANAYAINTLISANLLTPSGVLGGGRSIIAIQPSVGGVAKLNGSAVALFEYSPTTTSGVVCGRGTTYILQEIYNSLAPSGGAKVIGRIGAIYEHLSFRKPLHLNYALAMADPNILNTPKNTTPALINPNQQTMPVLTSSSVIQHTPGWCNFGDPCESAYLPKIIQVRQRGYLPPQTGGESTGSDQLATATL